MVAVLLVGLVACQPTPIATAPSPNTGESETATAQMPGQGVKVRPSTFAKPERRFFAEIINIGLEKLGYEVEEIKQLSPSIAHPVVGNGDLEFYIPHLEKSHAKFFEKGGGEEKLERVGVLIPNLLEGYSIDRQTAEQYKITDLGQLKDPELAKLFDSDGDGKANLAGCEVGQACERIIDYHLQAYELQKTVEHDKGSASILFADVLARHQQGKHVLYYTSIPSWFDYQLKIGKDVVWLPVPFTALPEGQQNFTDRDTLAEGKNLGFPVNRMQVLANKTFMEANPAAKCWIQQVQIPVEDLVTEFQRIAEGESSPEDIRRHAQEWVESNQQQVDTWLEEAKNPTTICS
ncbi:glycine betaine/L-proline ABC transporter substrate-binding protein ProX [Zarconia navalis]|uniref:glycine betaine/L-proline ABC transporter substrate-binding protein ProX n=1 Tax=Zarconia navalis TaxID=2992134 RepID=UPI0021F8F344|nr:glycine betaine/L-proline ABC transporter substrate-binding protein ProX [Zarconia navalis]